jgi:hypothetical protein
MRRGLARVSAPRSGRVVVAEEQRDETQAVSMAGAERDVVHQALALVLALTAAWTLTVRSPRS